ncbi:serine phosphatase RsbU, regulator of sigma subunit [Bernardetia litoralis DSM 6794]|uniref:Serine phosphatase RsbU, regulator of sigma subunit n=1 Tax=Bernardetia litoralis (strain ATCC 23117 / DSM 6794 / NBRC 15988 / NCIMB 1366 / Fx l1 / Sio-4) TaxID=880071 RepID=I4AK54_BERLS|nr:7TM diverse intracellular signaling domain-containing protein [Bernardetia litoralis]AFM04339.1 serine phosphatase RsbU, regulator of sigma subunit [Bernardetia litoralis DSM 6794]
MKIEEQKINLNFKVKYFGLLMIAFIFSTPLLAQPFTKKINSERLLILDSLKEKYELDTYFDVFKDRDNNFTFEALNAYSFAPYQFDDISEDVATYWLRISIKNPLYSTQKLLVPTGFIDSVTLFMEEVEGVYSTQLGGSLIPRSERGVKRGGISVSALEIPAQTTKTFFFRLHSSTKLSSQDARYSLRRWFTAYTPDGYEAEFLTARSFHNFFYGAIWVMLIYNLLVFIALRDRQYVFYVIYNFLVFIYIFSNIGQLGELFLMEYPRFDVGIRLFSGILSVFALLMFGKDHLKTIIFAPRWHRFIQVLVYITLGITTLYFLRFWHLGRILTTIILPLSLIALLFAGFKSYYEGHKNVKYFLWGNSFFVIAITIYSLELLLFIDASRYLETVVLASITLQMALFSYGLAATFNQTRKQLIHNKLQQEREKQILIEAKNKELEEKVTQRTNDLTEKAILLEEKQVEILTQSEQLQLQSDEISHQHKQMTDSIRYAEKIQQAILPSQETLHQTFEKHFVIFRPKDIVSGDFYWTATIQTAAPSIIPRRSPIEIQRGEVSRKIIAAVDCTGHGVPGAFMSVIGIILLNEIVHLKNTYNSDEILESLHKQIQKALRQDEKANADGMDVALCIVEETTENERIVYFTGAKRPLYYAENEKDKKSKLQTLQGTRKSIGGITRKEKAFVCEKIQLQKGAKLYLTSDGLIDQPNAKGKKIGSRKFEETLQEILHLPMEEQYVALMEMLDLHQQDTAQRDDITVIGIEI